MPWGTSEKTNRGSVRSPIKDKNMAHTYSQLLAHIVFAVKGREHVIPSFFREDLERYIAGYARNKGTKLLAVYCNPDHTHILLGYKPNLVLSDFVKDLKVSTNKYVNQSLVLAGKFNWQEGYGVFSCCPSNLQSVISYIRNQASHHNNKGFKVEYKELLEAAGVPFDEEYLFD